MNNRDYQAVIFDMDGTLTVPCIDFGEMRRRLGVAEGDILVTVRGWAPARQPGQFYEDVQFGAIPCSDASRAASVPAGYNAGA